MKHLGQAGLIALLLFVVGTGIWLNRTAWRHRRLMWQMQAAVVAGGEDVAVVGGDRIDRRVVRLHLAHQVARLRAPELNVARAAAANDDGMGGQEGQPANPVLVRIVQALDQFLALEIPLLDAVVAAGGEERVSLHCQALGKVRCI